MKTYPEIKAMTCTDIVTCDDSVAWDGMMTCGDKTKTWSEFVTCDDVMVVKSKR